MSPALLLRLHLAAHSSSSASKATDVFGTIEGYADVTGMCNSACVAVGMTAKATVTAATGELKGQTGTGTYTYTDAFELPELATSPTNSQA